MSLVFRSQCRIHCRRLFLSRCATPSAQRLGATTAAAAQHFHSSAAARHDEETPPPPPPPPPAAAVLDNGSSTASKRGIRGLGLLGGSSRAAANKTQQVVGGSRGGPGTRYILGQNADEKPIRARFAPSPTGYLHLGSLRTALFNNVAARASKDGGAFILRIEDTDQSRLVHDAEARLLEDLAWAGLSWDEGPDCGGPYGPYRQSERLPTYKEHAQMLIARGHAYRCFCTPAQLDAQKQQLHEAGRPTLYPGTCRRAVDAAESERRAAAGEPHVVRFHGAAFGRPKLRDAIYGHFQKKEDEEDFILVKSDGFPTYHFACVVDDHLMKITHVIRGEEWLISAPKHIALYQAFGWQPPIFAHLGLLVNPDGTKLSKRNRDANLSQYKTDRVFPAALLSWLANLGSSFKPNVKPPRSVEDIAEALTFKFTRGGIKLNLEKLTHFNDKYRDLLLRQDPASLPAHEAALLRTHLLEPTLALVQSATSTGGGTPAWPQQPQQQQQQPQQHSSPPLELVPQLSSDEDTRLAYVRVVLASRDGGFRAAREVVEQHPYLFWRPPRHVYAASVAATPPDARILQALEHVLSHAREEIWAGSSSSSGGRADGQAVMDALRGILDPQGVEALTIHNALRLVGAGGQDVVSQSSGRMFATLGREEWKHRLRCVQQLL